MLDRLEDVEHARFRALAQITLDVGADDRESGVEAFENYMKKAFPGVESKKQKKADEVKEALQWWVGRGPLEVAPMPEVTKRGKSRMVHRVQQVEKGDKNSLYRKMKKPWEN